MKPSTLSLAIAVALACSAPVLAQEESGADERSDATRLDNITVTARRRAETSQEVPVAVSSFDADDLRDMQARTVDGLQGSVPNLNIVQGRGSASSVNVFIRGIGQPDALQTFDPGVGIYVDDVYYSRIQGGLFTLFDVERIEVLRGPQGTLYGKNSTGGAIKLVTRAPGEETSGAFELTAGNYGRLEGRFYGTTPMTDSAGASLAVVSSGSDGYVRDTLTGRKYNDDDSNSARIKFGSIGEGDFRWNLTADYTRQNNSLTMGQPMAPLVQVDLVTGPRVLSVPSNQPWNYRSRSSFTDGEGQKLTHWGITLGLDWTLSSAWGLKSITAWRDLKTDFFIDIDGSEFELGDVFVGVDQDQFSQEFQFQYDNGDDLQAVFGLYYLRENIPSHQEAYADDFLALAGTPLSFLRTIDDDLRTTSYAGFAHVNWEFAPSWTLAAGLRYTHEKKDYFRTTSTFSNFPALTADPAFAFDVSDSWSSLTPSLSLQKQFSDQVMGYFSANRGFKSGGFNGRANSPADVSKFDPETVWTYEFGVKTSSEDGRRIVNLTAFHSDYKDFQARVSEITNPNDPIPNFSFPVLNAAKLRIQGIELESVALLGDGLRLSAQVGYQNAKYREFNDPRVDLNPALADLHDHVPFAPDWTARLAASHLFLLANDSTLTVGGDWNYKSKTWLSVDNREVLSQDAYGLLGMFASWDSADGRWQVRGGIKNMTDKLYKTDGQEFSSVGNIQTAYYGWPRHYYLALKYSF
jgi:iron complex outermembrane recepter protein